jgi:hypothetical protein
MEEKPDEVKLPKDASYPTVPSFWVRQQPPLRDLDLGEQDPIL